MAGIINAEAYRKLVQEDLDWLMNQPRTLERDHIAVILRCQIRDAADVVDREWKLHRQETRRESEAL